jgi:hypothetical protein
LDFLSQRWLKFSEEEELKQQNESLYLWGIARKLHV